MLLCLWILSVLILEYVVSACPKNHRCSPGLCNNETGYCTHGCLEGWNGPKCDTQNICPECKWGHCDGSRKCISGCIRGRYGEDCTKLCHAHCKNACEFVTGACLDECKDGWYGPYCSHQCSRGCNLDSCHRYIGHCSCRKGWYSLKCNRQCLGCFNNNCDNQGNCKEGCKPEWTGNQCSINKCSTCINGTCSWSSQDGTFVCADGCAIGYRGLLCQDKCQEDCELCSQYGSVCHFKTYKATHSYHQLTVTATTPTTEVNTRIGNFTHLESSTENSSTQNTDEGSYSNSTNTFADLRKTYILSVMIISGVTISAVFGVAAIYFCISYKRNQKNKRTGREHIDDQFYPLHAQETLELREVPFSESTNDDTMIFQVPPQPCGHRCFSNRVTGHGYEELYSSMSLNWRDSDEQTNSDYINPYNTLYQEPQQAQLYTPLTKQTGFVRQGHIPHSSELLMDNLNI